MGGKLFQRVLMLLHAQVGIEPRTLVKLEETCVISSKRSWVNPRDLYITFEHALLITAYLDVIIIEG
jgi:hypothetical protein